ncbi:MAG: DNA alkylation repair protein, partial [Melioribacteraceae bacterium]|nr:DNA alkylation repair protein [Melioribacteraceae bacterium]
MINNYIQEIKVLFERNANSENAFHMKKYMKDHSEFFGIKSPLRREITKPFLKKENLPPISSIKKITKELWSLPQREFQHFGMELLVKYLKKMTPDYINLFEYILLTKSWWDSVDFTSSNLVGAHFKNYPELIKPTTKKWIASENMWLQRSSIIFQLKYKSTTDTNLLFKYIQLCDDSKEFFIRKA